MTATKQRIPLAIADRFAADLAALLEPACREIHVVGSVRRRQPVVGDLELLVVPILEDIRDLFGEVVMQSSPLEPLCDRLYQDGVLGDRLDKNGRRAWGPRYKRATYRGLGLDLFACRPPAQQGLLLLIRTGPAEFSRRVVTARSEGGWLPRWHEVRDGGIYFTTGTLVETPTEEDVFRFIGRAYIAPEERR